VATDRAIPDELERVLRSHQLLHAAEGDLFEEALRGGSVLAWTTRCSGRAAYVHPPDVDALRGTIGSPWQKDHKLAAAAAFTLLS